MLFDPCLWCSFSFVFFFFHLFGVVVVVVLRSARFFFMLLLFSSLSCWISFFLFLLWTVNGLHFTIQITSYRVRDDDNDKGTQQQKTPMINFVHVKHSFSYCNAKMCDCVCACDEKKCVQFFLFIWQHFPCGGTMAQQTTGKRKKICEKNNNSSRAK